MPQVEVTFDVDANGILQVKAKDKTSGKEQSIRIEASSGLTDEDIKRMQSDAEAHAEEDKKKMELVEAKNLADQMIHTAEKALKDAEGKIGDDVKNEVQGAIDEVKKAREGTDIDAIKSASEKLSNSMMKIGEAMKSAQDAAPAPETPHEEKKDEGTQA
jgi:molecular chaperone DnaK